MIRDNYVAQNGRVGISWTGGADAAMCTPGNGTQVLGGANSYTGSTTVNAGLLRVNGSQTGNGAVTVGGGELNVNGSLGTSAVTLNAGILSGTGSVGAVTVNAGATLSPGNSPGTLTTGAVTFNGGGSYNWQLFNSTGSEGTGWDSINSSGGLTVNATSGSPFNFNLWTLSSTNPDTNGNAQNFNPAWAPDRNGFILLK